MPVMRREKRFKRAWRIVRPYDPVRQAEREAVDTVFPDRLTGSATGAGCAGRPPFRCPGPL
jgi:hypothetical protein